METNNSSITLEEFITYFKYQHKLVRSRKDVIETYESYCQAITKLRSDSIKYLKSLGVPGHVRSIYNDKLQTFVKYGHKEYLFYKDPTCGICLYPVFRIEEATIDHIYPISLGGDNSLENKQLAHGHCNVKKSNKIYVKKL